MSDNTLFTLQAKGDFTYINCKPFEAIELSYTSVAECLQDKILKSLLTQQLIKQCTIHQGGKKIATVPLMTWERFTEELISHAPQILRGAL